MEFRILGSVEVADGGLARDLGGLRERTLLARLLLSAGQVVSADRLADDLWEGSPPPHSMATLRVYISRLRRALRPDGAGLVATQPPGYRMLLAPGQLDARRFEDLAAAGRADLAAGQPEQAAARLREALGLWRGPALCDVADFSFARADAIRLEEARISALEDRVEADLACGRHASLTGELDGLAASYPLRERLCGDRMLALYRGGRQADALQAYQDLRVRLADELGIDPGPGLQKLQQAILCQDAELDWPPAGWQPPAGRAAQAPSGQRGPGHPGPDRVPAADAAGPGRTAGAASGGGRPGSWLPAETTTFIGREAELATIDELLGLSRLLTLTGPSGSGKTRLALRAAALAADGYPGGVWLAELAPVLGPDLVPAVVASALAIREEPGTPLPDSIVASLRGSEALLVVDNCEHVLDAAAGLIAVLLRGCPSLRILATSQSLLGVAGEASWPVPPLILPGAQDCDPQVVGAAESVRLFCDRAALARPGFRLTDQNAVPISEICRRLDGIPLALELAAAKLNALSPGQVAARLDDRFALLAGRGRGGLPRHRTLQAAIEWSHDLLSEAEKVCFRRLAVFTGGCTLEAAEAVCPDPNPAGVLPAGRMLETVSALVDRSLLTTEERCGSMRYGMLESIHQFARSQLDVAGEWAGLRQRHLDWLTGYARQADLEGPDTEAWLDLLEADLENFRAALAWSLDGLAREGQRQPALALAGALAPFWMVRGHIGFGRDWLESALAAAGPSADPRLRAAALDGAGQLAYVQADHDAQRGYQEESLAIWRQLGDDVRVASCLGDLGAAAHVRGEYPEALTMYTEALELATRAGDAQQMARALSGLGRIALHRGDLDQATGHYTASMNRFRQVGDLRRATLILGNLGVVAIHAGDFELAAARLDEHLANARRIGDRKLTGGALTNLGMVALNLDDTGRAARLHAEALTLGEQIGDRRLATVALTNLGLVALARKDFAAARGYHARSLALAEVTGELRSIAESLEELAAVDTAAGQMARAAELFGASQALREQIGSPVPAPDQARFSAAQSAVRAALGDEVFQAAQCTGRALSAAQAVALARQFQEES